MYVYGELQTALLEYLNADPTGMPGRVYWNYSSGQVGLYNGTSWRRFLLNDEHIVIGNNATAANNVRLHRGASGVLQHVTADDTTADGSTALPAKIAQVDNRKVNYLSSGLPAAGAAGRVAWQTDLGALAVDTGAAWNTVADTTTAQTLTNKTISDSGSSVTYPAIKSGAATSGQVLTADGSGNSGWVSPSSDNPSSIANLGLAASVATNALTISLKTKAGATPSAGSAVTIPFRSSTATTGTYSAVNVTSSLSITVPSTATIGQANGLAEYVYVYAINNAGTVLLGVSGRKLFDENSLQNTTSIAGGSNSGSTLYASSTLSGVAIRLLGRVAITEAAAGTWATAPTEISIDYTFIRQAIVAASYTHTALTPISITGVTWTTVNPDTKEYDTHNAVSSGVFTAPVDGYYKCTCNYGAIQSATASWNAFFRILKNGAIVLYNKFNGLASNSLYPMMLEKTFSLSAGDTIAFQVSSAVSQTMTYGNDNANANMMQIQFTRVPSFG